ncbi:glutathione S-transferase Mu 3 [Nematostella vectensis]|uniref:glutathione S-transferase Mu 3 n=1 Tax=Nematostella vectensis TaxID=45351 RepID=UPI00207708BC|nr:glutathione S-transferase Mu 3 [Nematostella vectensis]
MCGKTEEEKVIVDILENQLMDFRNGFVRLCYNNAAFEENKPAYIQSVQSSIKAFADFLGQKSYLAGDNLTFVDFVLYELLDQHRIFEASLLDAHPNLKAFLDRFEKLPAIAAYMSSNEFIKRPINNPIAAFA